MNGQPDKDKAADEVFNASRPFLKADESERVKGQLSYIVKDMNEEQKQSRSRDSTSKIITILLRNTIVTGFLLWLSEIILILHSKE